MRRFCSSACTDRLRASSPPSTSTVSPPPAVSTRGRGGHVMHFGIFVEEMRYGRDQVSAFRDAFELADQAEAWGLDCVWLGEIHFTPTRSVISASLQVASSIASRTRRLHVGTAV